MSVVVVKSWGSYEVVHEELNCVVKRLVIKPRSSTSLQYHNHRSEIWCVVQGEAQVFINEKLLLARKDDSFSVAIGDKHRVLNLSETEDFIAIEVWLGENLSEDDIVRIDYGV